MIGAQKAITKFSKILASSALAEGQRFKKYDFLIKILVFLLQYFIRNYCTSVHYTFEKRSLNRIKYHIICQYMLILGKVIKF